MTDWPRNPNGDYDALGDGMDSSGQIELAALGRAVSAVYVEDPARSAIARNRSRGNG